MKKIRSNSGFTLVPVMAILLLVLTLAGTAIANSILHLGTQETAVEQMKGKYIAAGKIENIYAGLRGLADDPPCEVLTKSEQLEVTDFMGIIRDFDQGSDRLEVDKGNKLFTVSVKRTADGATASAEFEVGYKDESSRGQATYSPGEAPTTEYKHNVTITSVRYTKFNISSETGVGG